MKPNESHKEKEEVLQRLQALEAQVGAVRSSYPLDKITTTTNIETKKDIEKRLQYLQRLAEGPREWK